MVKDLPDRFLGGDGSDDEEEVEKRWIKYETVTRSCVPFTTD